MPTIEISAEQQAYISALRDELAEKVTYGHVRELDAVQYLIDHHRDDGDLDVEIDPDIEAKLDEVEPDGGSVTQQADASGGVGATQDEEGSSEPSDDSGGGSTGTTTGGSVDDTVAALQSAGPGGSQQSSDSDSGDDGETVSGEPTGTVNDAGDDKVSQMMSLLDDHDDKWREASGGDARYEVDLPDGGTEPAQTKDDVRALLFKHY